MNTRIRCLVVFLLMAALAFGVYAGALDNPPLFDDETLLAGNARLTLSRASDLLTRRFFLLFEGEPTGWRPLSVLSYMVNRSLFGERFGLWRAVYLLGHAANAALLALLAMRLGASAAAAGGAVIFLLHPIHSEVVNMVSYNEEVMATLFVLLALLAWEARRRWKWATAAAATCYAAALLSKETALFLPLVLAAMDGPGEARNDRRDLIGLAGVGLLWAMIRFGFMSNPYDLRKMSAARGDLFHGLAYLPGMVGGYLGRFAWPAHLSAVYDVPDYGWRHPSVWIGLAALAGASGLAALNFRRGRPAWSVPALLFLAGLIPLGYGPVLRQRGYFYDHYFYLPAAAVVLLLIPGATVLARKAALPRPVAVWAGVLLVAAIAAGGTLVIRQRNAVWASHLALWSDAAAKAPRSAAAQYNLGVTRRDQGDAAGAEALYRRALELDPSYVDAAYNLASILYDRNDLAPAEELYTRVVGMKPAYANAFLNRGNIRFMTGRHLEAAADYQRVIELNPRSAMAWNNRGQALAGLGQAAPAADHFRRALEIDPDYRQAAANLSALRR